MAASDNVIRAGLTPKFKDTEVLCSSLTYEQGDTKRLGPPYVLKPAEINPPPSCVTEVPFGTS